MPVYEEKNKNKWTKDGRRYYFRCYYSDAYGNRKQKESKKYKSRPLAKKAEDDFLLKVAINDENDFDIMFEEVYKEWFLLKCRNTKKQQPIVSKLQLIVTLSNFLNLLNYTQSNLISY